MKRRSFFGKMIGGIAGLFAAKEIAAEPQVAKLECNPLCPVNCDCGPCECCMDCPEKKIQQEMSKEYDPHKRPVMFVFGLDKDGKRMLAPVLHAAD
jgi:hypothetical protein